MGSASASGGSFGVGWNWQCLTWGQLVESSHKETTSATFYHQNRVRETQYSCLSWIQIST